MNAKRDAGWSPYAAGALTGVLACVSVLLTGEFFGASTSFVRCAAVIEEFLTPQHAAGLDYFAKYLPRIDWQLMFVCGIFFGSLIAACTSGSFAWKPVPDMWRSRFGGSLLKRAPAAFAGGFVAIFGARLAGGCPSGHGLSGLMQLSVSGFVAIICFFAGGIPVAWLLYRKGGTS